MSSKELTVFTYENKGIRVFGTKNEPWFVAVDILRALGVHEKGLTRVLNRLDNDEKLVVKLTTNSPGNPDVWLVSEPGLYKILFRSNTPAAKSFTRFVTHDVLPSIRRYGYYKIPAQKKEYTWYSLATGEFRTKEQIRQMAVEYEIDDWSLKHCSIFRLNSLIDDKIFEQRNKEARKGYPYTFDEVDKMCTYNLDLVLYALDAFNDHPEWIKDFPLGGYCLTQELVDLVPVILEYYKKEDWDSIMQYRKRPW